LCQLVVVPAVVELVAAVEVAAAFSLGVVVVSVSLPLVAAAASVLLKPSLLHRVAQRPVLQATAAVVAAVPT
jgi:hypothetical protein